MQFKTIKNLENVELYEEADKINNKVKAGLEEENDFLKLESLFKKFSILHKYKECSFCKKIQVKFLYQAYLRAGNITEQASILEKSHDLAMDLVSQSENKKVNAPSFYKWLLVVKIELANVKQSQGFLEDTIALKRCAVRICLKARRMFPTYHDFPSIS